MSHALHYCDRIVFIPVPCGLGARHKRETVIQAPAMILEDGPAGLKEELRKTGWHVEVDPPVAAPRPALPQMEYSREPQNTQEIYAVCQELADRVERAVRRNALPIVLGGDHSIAVGSVAGSSAHFSVQGESIGVIWMDAHPDMNTPMTSPTGHIHGMPLACCVELAPEDRDSLAQLGDLATLVKPKLKGRNVCLFGVRNIDVEPYKHSELHVIENAKVRYFKVDPLTQPDEARAQMGEAIAAASEETSGFHLSLDIDFLDPEYAPDAGTPYERGASVLATYAALDAVRESGKMLSMDLVEIHPVPDGDMRTIKLAIDLLTHLLRR